MGTSERWLSSLKREAERTWVLAADGDADADGKAVYMTFFRLNTHQKC